MIPFGQIIWKNIANEEEIRKTTTLRLPTPPMETPDPPSDTPGVSKQVVLTPHDIPRSLREKHIPQEGHLPRFNE